MADNNYVKLFDFIRHYFKNTKKQNKHVTNEEGSFLVEVLVAASILLILAASAVSHLSTLTNIKIQTETRDRALTLMTSLHENMQSAGCGFDVGVTKIVVKDVVSLATTTPWSRVLTCAFSTIAATRNSPYAGIMIDEDGNAVLDNIYNDNLYFISAFCYDRAPDGKCELGDQEFIRPVILNDSGVEVKYEVKVNYWFEKTGTTNSSTACTGGTNTIDKVQQPDVIARKVTLSWKNISLASGKETISVTKRQNIPQDSIAFSSSTRVGGYFNSGSTVVMYPDIIDGSIQVSSLQVTRNTLSNGGSNCIWFPFLVKNAPTPTLFQDGATPKSSATLTVAPLGNGAI